MNKVKYILKLEVYMVWDNIMLRWYYELIVMEYIVMGRAWGRLYIKKGSPPMLLHQAQVEFAIGYSGILKCLVHFAVVHLYVGYF